jgi:hypothetical protein
VAVTQPALDEVLVVDRVTGGTVATVPTGPTPIGVMFDGERLLVTTAGDRAWVEYEPHAWTPIRSGTLPSGASHLTMRGPDLYFVSLGTSEVVHYSLDEGAVVGSVRVNGIANAAFGQHTALVGSDEPENVAVVVDLDSMSVSSVTATPSTPDDLAWAAGFYYLTFYADRSVVRMPGD